MSLAKTTLPSYFWYLVAFLGIGIGVYPVLYFVADMQSNGLLAGKGFLLENWMYMLAFYVHILGGGIALLSGWSQFRRTLRNSRLGLHRFLGKIYVVVVLVFGAPSGLAIALFAEGGLPSIAGFSLMAIAWWSFTFNAYLKIRKGDIEEHLQWMIRSYAVCFAAVTLRIWLPLFTAGFGYSFQEAYPMIAWLCWVPNLFVAEWIISKRWVMA